MTKEIITLGDNMEAPHVNMEVTQSIYDCVRTEEFEVDVFNSLLAAVMAYCDIHGVKFNVGDLPRAESVTSA